MPQTLESLMHLHLTALASLLVEVSCELHKEANEARRYRLKLELDKILQELRHAKGHIS